MRLNKYLAHCGICTRKEGETIIKKGCVKVNDEIVVLPHHEVAETDIVTYKDNIVKPKENYEYYVINKAQKTLVSSNEKSYKPTVIDLLLKTTQTLLQPVNDGPKDIFCGLLVMTSDKKLIHHLTSDIHKLKSTYQCVLDKPYDSSVFEKIKKTLYNKNPNITLLGIGYPDESDKRIVGIDMIGGNAQIWLDIFESYEYKIQKMDCTFYGGLTKKDLKRDWYRKLTDKEVVFLKYFSS